MQTESPARSPLHTVVNLLVSGLVIAGCVFGYTFLGERERPVRGKPPKSDAAVVKTEPMIPYDDVFSLSANGVVVPFREIRLATEVAGRIVHQADNLRAGRLVAAGETLIELDVTQYELEVRRFVSQQSLESAELAATDISIENTTELLSLANEQLKLASKEKSRVDSLVQRQAASMSEVDATERAELITRAALLELENRKRELIAGRELIVQKQAATEVSLQRAQWDLDRTTIKSPIRGRVITSMVEEQSFLAAGTPFVTIEDTSVVEVRSNLTVDQMYRIWNAGMADSGGDVTAPTADDQVPPVPATIQYRLGTRTYQWQAVLERIDGAGIDAATRTYPCLFRVNAPESVTRLTESALSDGPKRLMRGMFVTVILNTQSRRPLVRFSEMAVRPGNRVWINRDGKLHVQSIEIVARQDDCVIVDAEGLITPDQPNLVVVSPISNPLEGMKLLEAGGADSPPNPSPPNPSGPPPKKSGPQIADESKPVVEKAAG